MSSPQFHPPVAIRDAATVVLLRDGAAGLEAWLLTRVSQMAFAGGMTVFPGGRVDPADADVPLTGASLPRVLERLGGDEGRAMIAAAVRETFEETGVLLSTPTADLADRRAAVEAHEIDFAALLAENGLAADADLVVPWARWVTPEGEARRYDTRFFVAALPVGATAVTGTTEASASGWVPIQAALDEARAGQRTLLPPTIVTLTTLTQHDTVAGVLAAGDSQSLDPVSPTLHIEGELVFADLGNGTRFEIPRSMLR